MKRKDVYLSQEQIDFLETKGLSLSEHIRRAIDAYIFKLKGINVSASRSESD